MENTDKKGVKSKIASAVSWIVLKELAYSIFEGLRDNIEDLLG